MSSYPGKNTFQTFVEFMNSVQSSKSEQYLGIAENRVASVDAFRAMREYIIEQYKGVEVLHSFVDKNGSVFDCIPIEQQSSLRKSGNRVSTPPDFPKSEKKTDSVEEKKATLIQSPFREDRKDQFGNVMVCPQGTIPKRRITLDELARFETLRNFFRKSPTKSDLPANQLADTAVRSIEPTHKYAHAYQVIDNVGGHSFLNLWAPAVDPLNYDVFSLSQHWYSAGTSVGTDLRTVEVGWQVFPTKYYSTFPVLFVYWTADNYNNTGSYNLDNDEFTQTSSAYALGGVFDDISIREGTQTEIELAYWLYQGNWWLYVGGQPLGYYPSSNFSGGSFTTKAQRIDYGGETLGTYHWPAMGSGSFANEGYQKAAYQKDISYFDNAGLANQPYLTLDQPSSWCYTAEIVNYAPPWNTTLYFGGPGGSNC